MLRFKSIEDARQHAINLIENEELELSLAVIKCALAITKLRLAL